MNILFEQFLEKVIDKASKQGHLNNYLTFKIVKDNELPQKIKSEFKKESGKSGNKNSFYICFKPVKDTENIRKNQGEFQTKISNLIINNISYDKSEQFNSSDVTVVDLKNPENENSKGNIFFIVLVEKIII